MNTDSLTTLKATIGDAYVLTDEASRIFYAQDVSKRDIPAMAVAQPANAEELAAVVRTVTDAGHTVIARGGGMSYTAGFVPTSPGTVIVDTQRMSQVLEVNTVDMFVTVQAGCTWKDLAAALDGTGCRTPFWGTLSGIHATVGGSVSQNSIFWGSGRYGTAAESVLSMDIVLADGSLITTGAAAAENVTPFFRHYGPDLTGLFTSDTGALGLKANITLRLIPVCDHRDGVSFDFDAPDQLIAAMSEISRRGLADECFAFDPRLQSVRLQRESLASDLRKFTGVLKSAGSLVGALREGAKVALAGRSFMDDVDYSLHVMVEQRYQESLIATLAEVRDICGAFDGREISNSIPTVLRANPFTPLNNMVGPNGERWLPVHAVVPHSKAAETFSRIEALFDSHAALMETHGIGYGFLLTTIANNGFVLEPVFFTPDALGELHKATVEPSVLKNMAGFEDNPAARAATEQLKQELIGVFTEAGGVHMQIGKTYPYRQSLRPESWRLVSALKDAVDAEGRVNPGSLGLD